MIKEVSMAYCVTNIGENIERRVAVYKQAIAETEAPLWIGEADYRAPIMAGWRGLWAFGDGPGDLSKFWEIVRRIDTAS